MGPRRPAFRAERKTEEIDGNVKKTGEVLVDDEKIGRMDSPTGSNYQNQIVGWLRMNGNSPGGEMLVQSPRILSYLGNVG